MISADQRNTLGICIFAWNEEDHIEDTLGSVTAWQNHTGTVSEIVVVDDGSQDNTGFLVKQAMKANSSIQLIEHGLNRGPTEALRTGLAHLTTDYVLLLPGDYTYSRDAIRDIILLWKESTPPMTLILGARNSSRMRRSRSREAAAALALLPLRLLGPSGKTLPSVGLILFPRALGSLIPRGVIGYGQGIGLLGTLIAARIPVVSVDVEQVAGSESRGSHLTGRKIWDVLVTHMSLLRSRNRIRRASNEFAPTKLGLELSCNAGEAGVSSLRHEKSQSLH